MKRTESQVIRDPHDDDDPYGSKHEFVYNIAGTPGISSVTFSYANYCELWLAFTLCNRYNIIRALVAPIQKRYQDSENRECRDYIPIFIRSLEHADVTGDPSLLYLIYIYSIAHWAPVRTYALRKGLTLAEQHSIKPLLPPGCEVECIEGFKLLCTQISQRRITLQRFIELAFMVVNVGSRWPAEPTWQISEPPLPLDRDHVEEAPIAKTVVEPMRRPSEKDDAEDSDASMSDGEEYARDGAESGVEIDYPGSECEPE